MLTFSHSLWASSLHPGRTKNRSNFKPDLRNHAPSLNPNMLPADPVAYEEMRNEDF
jgi:hypothetical protein